MKKKKTTVLITSKQHTNPLSKNEEFEESRKRQPLLVEPNYAKFHFSFLHSQKPNPFRNANPNLQKFKRELFINKQKTKRKSFRAD